MCLFRRRSAGLRSRLPTLPATRRFACPMLFTCWRRTPQGEGRRVSRSSAGCTGTRRCSLLPTRFSKALIFTVASHLLRSRRPCLEHGPWYFIFGLLHGLAAPAIAHAIQYHDRVEYMPKRRPFNVSASPGTPLAAAGAHEYRSCHPHGAGTHVLCAVSARHGVRSR